MKKPLLIFAFTLAASTSFASEPGAGYGGSVGALAMEARGVATNAAEVRAQGGFATAGAVHWTGAPRARTQAATAY